MASYSRPSPPDVIAKPPLTPLPNQYAIDAVTDDLIDVMRTYTQDNFISTICADQIEHIRQLNRPNTPRDHKRRHSTPTHLPPAPPAAATPSRSEMHSTSDPIPDSPISPSSDSGTNTNARTNVDKNPSQLTLLMYLHQKTQSLPIIMDMARSCYAMDQTALVHNEYTIRNLLARVRALGASVEDRDVLDHLYNVKQVLWDKIVVWQCLEDKWWPRRLSGLSVVEEAECGLFMAAG